MSNEIVDSKFEQIWEEIMKTSEDKRTDYFDVIHMIFSIEDGTVKFQPELDEVIEFSKSNQRFISYLEPKDFLHGWYKELWIKRPQHQLKEVIVEILWFLNRETTGKFTISASNVFFENKADAMLYKIKYGGQVS